MYTYARCGLDFDVYVCVCLHVRIHTRILELERGLDFDIYVCVYVCTYMHMQAPLHRGCFGLASHLCRQVTVTYA
jgi:hypothetical protein